MGDRRGSDRAFGSGRQFEAAGSEFGGERRRDNFPEGDGKVRDFGNWERKGPLTPLPQEERQSGSREGGRTRTNDEGFSNRRASPAAWGEGRGQGSQDGSRPPRREFQERPAVAREPTAAEQDSQWRTKMRPDAPAVTSPGPSREGSEGPKSPAAAPSAPVGRPKLNLAKRTVSEAHPISSPSGDAKASPFGAARPIDTAAKEKEIEEKRLAALEEKKVADEKVKEDKRVAKEAEKAAEAEKKESGETIETENANGEIVDDKAVKPNEVVRDSKPAARPSENAWRRPSGGPKQDAPRGPRRDGPGPRRNDNPRPQRQNGNTAASPAASATSPTTEQPTGETASLEEDGWSTVSKPKKNQRGGNQGSRAIAS